MARLSLHLLGSFRVTLGDEPVSTFESDKVRALLTYLAVTSDRAHRREKLAGLLWPEQPERNARHSLNQALFNLRRAIGDQDASPPLLLITRQALQFNPRSDRWLDVATFAGLLDACETHPHRQLATCEVCVERLREAASLYRGSFLEGFSIPDSAPFEEWALLERERLQRLVVDALRQLAGHNERRGEYGKGLAHLCRWVGLEPWREEAHRKLMKLLALSGQRSAALAQYEAYRSILAEELNAEPEEETTALYERIRGRSGPGARSLAVPHNLPAQSTVFVGREDELVEIYQYLQDPACRLLTLVGSGGSGKTRLALQAGAGILSGAQLDGFEDGVFFVSLASLRSAEGIVSAVVSALGSSLSGSADLQRQLLACLRGKSLLLILDNFEHLLSSSVQSLPRDPALSLSKGQGIEAGEGLVVDVLRAAPDVKILVTSRARLKVQGEQPFLVGGLQYPKRALSSAIDADRYSALKLFATSAHRADPSFEPTERGLAGIARVCRLVSGMPPGIVLAAAWADVLTPAQIADEIERSLDFLETDLRDVPDRQRSMRAAIAHSWSLLTQQQRAVVQALSVFRGGFTLEAARRVAGVSTRELKRLVDRSLVQRVPTRRYEMHELLRQYSEERLDSSPRARETAHDRHCAHFIDALEQWGFDRPGQRAVVAEIRLDIENARAAWAWAAERGQAERLGRAFDALDRYHYWYGGWREFGVMCETAAQALERTESEEGLQVLGKILTCWMLHLSGSRWDDDARRRLIRRCTPLLDRLELADQDTRPVRARILGTRAELMWLPGPERSRLLREQSLALYRDLDDQYEVADSLHQLGLLAKNQGQLSESERLFREVVAISRGQWTRIRGTCALRDLAEVFIYAGQFERARAHLVERLTDYDDLGDIQGSACRHGLIGLAHLGLGEYEQARDQAECAVAVCREYGVPGVYHVLPGDVIARVALVKAQRLVDKGTAAHPPQSDNARLAYAEARRLAQESVHVCRGRDASAPRHLGVVLSLLAMAERGLGESVQARQRLYEALRASLHGAFMIQVFPVCGIALLLVDAGEHERAVELYALASRYPCVANSRWFEDVFGRHIDAVAATLPPEVAEAARERGRERDLQATVKELLAEFEA